jgi:hypothetical protein
MKIYSDTIASIASSLQYEGFKQHGRYIASKCQSLNRCKNDKNDGFGEKKSKYR